MPRLDTLAGGKLSVVCLLSCSAVVQMFHLRLVPLVFQADVVDGRSPIIKKCLFPLFISKNHLKHNSSMKVLPVVSSPMVYLYIHKPALPINKPKPVSPKTVPLHATNISNQPYFQISKSCWPVLFCSTSTRSIRCSPLFLKTYSSGSFCHVRHSKKLKSIICCHLWIKTIESAHSKENSHNTFADCQGQLQPGVQ